jgi:hypothetical protein
LAIAVGAIAYEKSPESYGTTLPLFREKEVRRDLERLDVARPDKKVMMVDGGWATGK